MTIHFLSAATSYQAHALSTAAQPKGLQQRAQSREPLLLSETTLSLGSNSIGTVQALQTYFPQVKFGSLRGTSGNFHYGPTKQEIGSVVEAINGYARNRHIRGVSAYPQSDTLAWMKDWFYTKFNNVHKDDSLRFPNQLQERLVRDRLQYLNFYNLCLGRPPASQDTVVREVQNLSEELSQVLPYVNEQLKTRFKYQELERLFLSSVFAQTAPVLFNMGYNDAIAHSAQVALLSVIQMDRMLNSQAQQAKKPSLTQQERVPRLLQAAIMGWLHDVKLDGSLSASNLATHPIVGSALAKDLFSRRELRNGLNAMLGHWKSSTPMTTEQFIEGIVTALTVNNDFRFVLDRAILHSPSFLKRAEPGLIEQLQAKGVSSTQIEQFDEMAHQRFKAGTDQKTPPKFPPAIERLLRDQTSFETGLVAIDLRKLPTQEVEAYLDKLVPEIYTLDDFIDAWCSGQIVGKTGSDAASRSYNEAVAGLESLIQQAATSPRVSGLTQFAHAEEMPPVAKPLALILTLSDPLLLSPHKVMLTAQKYSTLSETMDNYLKGFKLVVADTPASYRTQVEWLYRDIMLGLLKSTAKFTQQPYLFHDYVTYAQGHELTDQLDYLEEVLTSPRTWNAAGTGNLLPAQNDQARKILESLCAIIKEDYTEVAWKSQNLFGTEDLEALAGSEVFGMNTDFHYLEAMATLGGDSAVELRRARRKRNRQTRGRFRF